MISWFRIQEMFRFQSLHMYLIIGSAIATAALPLGLIRKPQLRALSADAISVPPKTLGKGTRYWLGGSIFGLDGR